MARYFMEVAYKGTRYSGFQVQENAVTIQSEIEKAFAAIHRKHLALTGSSRTDAGVHALQNYFHFDWHDELHPQLLYKLNAILPPDIAVKSIKSMSDTAHCRFDALSREYTYRIYREKNPFLQETAYHYPYTLNNDLLHEAAVYVLAQTNFFAFCKTNTQVTNFKCTVIKSQWLECDGLLIYNIEGNRFLRGMVRLLTATILKVSRGNISLNEFKQFFEGHTKCGFSVPSHGLFLEKVVYPPAYFGPL